jgi:hypothetical protein
MPFILKLKTDTGDIISSPPIVPNNPNSIYGLEDKTIEREIKRTGMALVKRFSDLTEWECYHYF